MTVGYLLNIALVQIFSIRAKAIENRGRLPIQCHSFLDNLVQFSGDLNKIELGLYFKFLPVLKLS